MNHLNYQLAPQASVYIETKAFGLSHLPTVGFSPALAAGPGPGRSGSALLHSSCSKTQLEAARLALRPKIMLHVSHPECSAESSSCRDAFGGKWLPQTFCLCSYF